MGHVRAAQSLVHAFENMGLGDCVRHEDALDYAGAPLRQLYSRAYADLVEKAPEVLGWFYERSGKLWESEKHGLAFERLNIRSLIKIVEDYAPDVVISTHSLPADMMSWLLCKGAISARHAIVVTDFDIHTIWLCHHYSRYFVAIDETREYLEQLGFEHDRISVSGIPVDPVFLEKKDKQEMRNKHALDSDRLTILISAGGVGMGPMEQILASLKQLKQRFQVVAVCGKNKELKETIERVSTDYSLSSNGIMRAVGYTSQMDEYMAASDLIVGKPGGLTVCEALAKGLVFVIVSPIPGQEERNADHLLEEGVAIRCNNLPTLAYKIDQLINNPLRFCTMQENSLRLGRPHAAERIAREVCELIETDTASVVHPSSHRCAANKHLIA